MVNGQSMDAIEIAIVQLYHPTAFGFSIPPDIAPFSQQYSSWGTFMYVLYTTSCFMQITRVKVVLSIKLEVAM